jgi:hypothetical protein
MTWSAQDRDPRAAAGHTPRDRRRRARGPAILRAARGRRHRHRAADVALRGRRLQHGLQAPPPRGRNGLKRRWAPGRTARLPEARALTLRPWISPGPAGCGVARAHGVKDY